MRYGWPSLSAKNKYAFPDHMACLPTIHHLMWHTLPVRMSITPFPYSLKADNQTKKKILSFYPKKTKTLQRKFIEAPKRESK